MNPKLRKFLYQLTTPLAEQRLHSELQKVALVNAHLQELVSDHGEAIPEDILKTISYLDHVMQSIKA